MIAAAKSAAEVLARHEAASGEQAAALEALDERARATEAESRRLGRLLMEAAEEREQLIQELRSESEAKARANAAVAAASDPAAPVNAARDEVVARLTRDLEESRAALSAAQEAAARAEALVGGVDASAAAASRTSSS